MLVAVKMTYFQDITKGQPCSKCFLSHGPEMSKA